MVDYRDEVRLGKEVLARTVEAYRKIRNTFRYLLSNLYDFDPATDAVPRPSMLEVDRFALLAFARLADDVRRAYEAYDFQAIFHAINEFVTVDLSAFYLDVSKDRLYTFARAIARAPVGADGVVCRSPTAWRGCWRRCSRSRPTKSGSGCRARAKRRCTWRRFPTTRADWRDAEPRGTTGGGCSTCAASVNAALEGARQRKEIGNALAAHVDRSRVRRRSPTCSKRYAADLPMMLHHVVGVTGRPRRHGELTVRVSPRRGREVPALLARSSPTSRRRTATWRRPVRALRRRDRRRGAR